MVWFFFHRGNAYLHIREYENALFDFDRALQLDSRVSHIYNGRGRAYSGKGDHESAIDDFSSAIELDPIAVSYKHLTLPTIYSV